MAIDPLTHVHHAPKLHLKFTSVVVQPLRMCSACLMPMACIDLPSVVGLAHSADCFCVDSVISDDDTQQHIQMLHPEAPCSTEAEQCT
jgi:hypothetical protein